jgi:hypothetical protein
MTARTVCGCMPPNLAPAPRDPATVAQELADAAERLDMLAHRIFAAGDATGEPETFELDALACGISRAACELRARHRAQGGEHA